MREERAKPGTPKPRIRISFRSQGDRPVNVWAGEVFHGGGHANASGATVYSKEEEDALLNDADALLKAHKEAHPEDF